MRLKIPQALRRNWLHFSTDPVLVDGSSRNHAGILRQTASSSRRALSPILCEIRERASLENRRYFAKSHHHDAYQSLAFQRDVEDRSGNRKRQNRTNRHGRCEGLSSRQIAPKSIQHAMSSFLPSAMQVPRIAALLNEREQTRRILSSTPDANPAHSFSTAIGSSEENQGKNR